MKNKRRIILFLVVLLQLIVLQAVASGDIKGIVKDENGDGIPYATVSVIKNGTVVTAVSTDFDGKYFIKGIAPETYQVKTYSIGYTVQIKEKVRIEEGKITFLDFTLKNDAVLLEAVEIETKRPLIRISEPTTSTTMKRQEILQAPVLNSISTTPGVFSKDGDIDNIRGSRMGIPNTEQYDTIVENKFISPFTDPLSTFSIDVDRASYTNVRRFINGGQMPDKDAVRLEEMINYFHYDYPQPTGEHPFSINMEMSSCPWNTQHHLVLVGLQGKEIKPEDFPPSNIVFLIDVSGSMGAENKLPLVKSSMKALVSQLRKEDKVSIVVYAGNAGLVLAPTSGDKKSEIMDAINRLEAGGSTAGGAGIQLAYKQAEEHFMKNGNNRVILATDGDFNVGVSNDDELVKLIEEKRKTGIYLTVLGYGMGNYKDSKMEKLADKGNGNYGYIDTQQEAEKMLVSEFAGTMYAIAKDVKLQLEFNPAIVKNYRLIGYENRLLEDWEFNDDTRDAGELGSGHTVTAIYEIELNEKPVTTGQKDSLKYQVTDLSAAAGTNEILTIKFRYKLPKEDKSNLIEQVLMNMDKPYDSASENLRFASAVVGFGMLLRDSEFKGNMNYEKVIEMGKNAKGKDDEGYRSEFIQLVKTVRTLK